MPPGKWQQVVDSIRSTDPKGPRTKAWAALGVREETHQNNGGRGRNRRPTYWNPEGHNSIALKAGLGELLGYKFSLGFPKVPQSCFRSRSGFAAAIAPFM